MGLITGVVLPLPDLKRMQYLYCLQVKLYYVVVPSRISPTEVIIADSKSAKISNKSEVANLIVFLLDNDKSLIEIRDNNFGFFL